MVLRFKLLRLLGCGIGCLYWLAGGLGIVFSLGEMCYLVAVCLRVVYFEDGCYLTCRFRVGCGVA